MNYEKKWEEAMESGAKYAIEAGKLTAQVKHLEQQLDLAKMSCEGFSDLYADVCQEVLELTKELEVLRG